ncbi:hypothetical protein Dsin_012023 [Dipteronia sinensis]|uniref:Uncharacterized protein n=1 Tax=Dipteronia sinensis TaxID=43782 RepID=A0AAE0AH82_9ROSI|nr:hypothetical protein Dsin_012023 [Dipteronia sinensis]
MASGLRINFHKSCIAKVGKKGIVDDTWAATFRFKKAKLPITYLGLPLRARSNRKDFWNPIVTKIEKKLSPWKRKFLNKGGRLVLIKSVLSSIPSYFLSVFKVPIGVANTIEKLQRSFLWGDGIEKRKIHAIDWETMCKNKKFGRLGIGRMVDKNRSLLAKWVWRFGTEENALWRRILCASLFEVNSPAGKVLMDGLKVVISDGGKAKFWDTPGGDSVQIRITCLRIFALAVNKSGVV